MEPMKPCPFCGETARFELYVWLTSHLGQKVSMKCLKCGMVGPDAYAKTDQMEPVARAKWNQRVSLS